MSAVTSRKLYHKLQNSAHKKVRSGNNCCVPGCNNRNSTGISFYRLPSCEIRRKQWLDLISGKNNDSGQHGQAWKNANWTPRSWHRVCSAHFINGVKDNNECRRNYNPLLFPHNNYHVSEEYINEQIALQKESVFTTRPLPSLNKPTVKSLKTVTKFSPKDLSDSEELSMASDRSSTTGTVKRKLCELSLPQKAPSRKTPKMVSLLTSPRRNSFKKVVLLNKRPSTGQSEKQVLFLPVNGSNGPKESVPASKSSKSLLLNSRRAKRAPQVNIRKMSASEYVKKMPVSEFTRITSIPELIAGPDVEESDGKNKSKVNSQAMHNFHMAPKLRGQQLVFGLKSIASNKRAVFECNMCTARFDSEDQLMVHVYSHIFSCSLCSFRSLSRSDLLRHTLDKHENLTDQYKNTSAMIIDLDSYFSSRQLTQSVGTRGSLLVPPILSELERYFLEIFIELEVYLDSDGLIWCPDCEDIGSNNLLGIISHRNDKHQFNVPQFSCCYCPYFSVNRSMTLRHLSLCHPRQPRRLKKSQHLCQSSLNSAFKIMWFCEKCQLYNYDKRGMQRHLLSVHQETFCGAPDCSTREGVGTEMENVQENSSSSDGGVSVKPGLEVSEEPDTLLESAEMEVGIFDSMEIADKSLPNKGIEAVSAKSRSANMKCFVTRLVSNCDTLTDGTLVFTVNNFGETISQFDRQAAFAGDSSQLSSLLSHNEQFREGLREMTFEAAKYVLRPEKEAPGNSIKLTMKSEPTEDSLLDDVVCNGNLNDEFVLDSKDTQHASQVAQAVEEFLSFGNGSEILNKEDADADITDDENSQDSCDQFMIDFDENDLGSFANPEMAQVKETLVDLDGTKVYYLSPDSKWEEELSQLFTMEGSGEDTVATCLRCYREIKGRRALTYMKEHVTRHTTDHFWGCPYCMFRRHRRIEMIQHVRRKHPLQECAIIRRRPKMNNKLQARGRDNFEENHVESPAPPSAAGNVLNAEISQRLTHHNPHRSVGDELLDLEGPMNGVDGARVLYFKMLPDDLKCDVREHMTVKGSGNSTEIQCKLCNYQSHGKRALDYMKEHVTNHTGAKLWQCPYCGFKKNRRSEMVSHVAKIHSCLPLEIIRRKPRHADYVSDLAEKVPAEASGSAKLSLADATDVRDALKSMLDGSVVAADGVEVYCMKPKLEKNIADSQCLFTVSGNGDDQSVTCSICMYVCRGRRAQRIMREHVAWHSGDQPWGCLYCHSRRNRRSEMVAHVLKRHSQEKLSIVSRRQSDTSPDGVDTGSTEYKIYSCMVCNRSDVRRSLIKRHSRLLHGDCEISERPWPIKRKESKVCEEISDKLSVWLMPLEEMALDPDWQDYIANGGKFETHTKRIDPTPEELLKPLRMNPGYFYCPHCSYDVEGSSYAVKKHIKAKHRSENYVALYRRARCPKVCRHHMCLDTHCVYVAPSLQNLLQHYRCNPSHIDLSESCGLEMRDLVAEQENELAYEEHDQTTSSMVQMQCFFCPAVEPTELSIKQHALSSHAKLFPISVNLERKLARKACRLLQCPSCSYFSSRPFDMKRHLHSEHNGEFIDKLELSLKQSDSNSSYTTPVSSRLKRKSCMSTSALQSVKFKKISSSPENVQEDDEEDEKTSKTNFKRSLQTKRESRQPRKSQSKLPTAQNNVSSSPAQAVLSKDIPLVIPAMERYRCETCGFLAPHPQAIRRHAVFTHTATFRASGRQCCAVCVLDRRSRDEKLYLCANDACDFISSEEVKLWNHAEECHGITEVDDDDDEDDDDDDDDDSKVSVNSNDDNSRDSDDSNDSDSSGLW